MTKNVRHLPISLAKRIVLAGLLLCMALAQSLSFAHRALHHDVRMLAHAHEHEVLHVEQSGEAHAHGAACDHGIFNRLFAGHEEGDETCRVIDSAYTFLDTNSLLAPVFTAQSAHLFIAFDAASRAAWRAPLFEARGPPLPSL